MWMLKREQELLPVTYYHVVFTIPHELNNLCKNHPRLMYNILFRAAWFSLKMLMGNEKWCGAQAGMMAVLHTWGQNLSLHPHLHCVVPAGGLSFDETEWVNTQKAGILVDVVKLSALFQKTFLKMLREHWEFEGIEFRGKAQKYEAIQEWRALFESIQKPWVVYVKRPSTGPKQTLEYLSRYTHAVAISEGRILEVHEEKVQIQYKDYADEDENGLPKKKEMDLDGMVFIKKFVQHILPSGFQKIRYFGIWASANRKTKLAKAQKLLNHVPIVLTMQIIKAIIHQKIGIDPTICRHCGSANIVTEILIPQTFKPQKVVVMASPTPQNRPPPQQQIFPKTGNTKKRA